LLRGCLNRLALAFVFAHLCFIVSFDGATEFAHALAQRAPDLSNPIGAEHEDDNYQDNE